MPTIVPVPGSIRRSAGRVTRGVLGAAVGDEAVAMRRLTLPTPPVLLRGYARSSAGGTTAVAGRRSFGDPAASPNRQGASLNPTTTSTAPAAADLQAVRAHLGIEV